MNLLFVELILYNFFVKNTRLCNAHNFVYLGTYRCVLLYLCIMVSASITEEHQTIVGILHCIIYLLRSQFFSDEHATIEPHLLDLAKLHVI